jgi:hypothetical protein
MLLLEGFYDLAEGKPNEPVPVGDEDSTEEDAAAPKVGMDPGSPDCEVALRYLVDQGYIKADDEQSGTYTLTVPGIDRIKEMRDAE